MTKQVKKSRPKAKNPRRPVFDRALEEAQRKLAKAKEIQLKSQEKLVWASQEIPRLEGIIRAFGGKSDVGREPTQMSVAYRNSKTGLETPVTPVQRPRNVEVLADIPIAGAVDTTDENWALPDVDK